LAATSVPWWSLRPLRFFFLNDIRQDRNYKLVPTNWDYDSPQTLERDQKILNVLDFRAQRSSGDRLGIVTDASLGVIHAPAERQETHTQSYGSSDKRPLHYHALSTADLAHSYELSISVPESG
jgi:hypothetical protein